jgi:ribonuclease P protein component
MPWGDEPLKSKKAIDQLFREGEGHHGRLTVLIVRRTESGPRRVLFVTSRRVGNAVSRNRARRLLREAYRRHAGRLLDPAIHLAWVARRRCPETGMAEVWSDMAELLRRARLLPPSAEDKHGTTE